MRPRLSAALLFLSALALLAFAAPAAPASPHASGVDGPTLTGAPPALSSTSLGGAAEQSAGAAVAPLRGTAAAALAALERRQQQLTASDPSIDQSFGFSIAISGDTAVVGALARNVGANAQQGAVYVFMRAGATWTQQQVLTASDGAAGDLFGAAVALSGDDLLIGASNGARQGPGAAYVFSRSGATWTEQQKLTASDSTDNCLFGFSVALDGDTAVVGAPAQPYDSAADAPGPGAAYVFTRSAATWSLQQELADGVSAAGVWGRFGYGLALDGDTIMISELGRTVGENASQGAVHVYARSGNAWSRRQLLVQSDGGAWDGFGGGGASIALEGDTALLGASHHQVGDNAAQGAVYVFTREGGAWRQRQELTSSDGMSDDRFGDSVALDGDAALIGASQRTPAENPGPGAAYVVRRAGGDWAQDGDALRAGDGAAGDDFGLTVALCGGSALVGAYGKAIDGVAGAGAAYVFGLPSTITASANGHGTISPGGAQTVGYGATPMFAFTPDRGYRVKVVTIDGEVVSAAGSAYTFPAVVADHAIVVRFAALRNNRPSCTVSGWKPGWQDRPMRLVFAGHVGPYGIAVARTEYRLGDGAWKTGGHVTVRREGVTRVRYRAIDIDGNVGAAKSRVVRIHG